MLFPTSYRLSGHKDLFKSFRDAPPVADTQAPASNALELISKMSPEKKKRDCGQWLSVDHKFCPHCGQKNHQFDASKAAMLQAGHRKGWQKKEAPTDLDGAADPEEGPLLSQLDDLMQELRKRKKPEAAISEAAPSNAAPVPELNAGDPAPLVADTNSKKPKSESAAASSSSAAPPAASPAAAQSAETALSDEEHDLATEQGCCSFILASFSKQRRDEVKPIAEFYVSHLKSQTSKKISLWEVFAKSVISPNILKSAAGRNAWLSAWQSNRAKRFAKVQKQN